MPFISRPRACQWCWRDIFEQEPPLPCPHLPASQLSLPPPLSSFRMTRQPLRRPLPFRRKQPSPPLVSSQVGAPGISPQPHIGDMNQSSRPHGGTRQARRVCHWREQPPHGFPSASRKPFSHISSAIA